MRNDPSAFPAVRIEARGDVSTRVRELGIVDLRKAVRFVRNLPYGRPADPENPLAVLDERVGTCSTKHALLARLCAEQDVTDVRLTLGVYEMDGRNTPGVGPVLDAHGLDAIPEAHCYFRYGGSRFDFTRSSSDGAPIERFLHEETIDPAQIGDYKERVHRAFLAEWSESLDRDPEGLWAIREECIAALSAEGDAQTSGPL